MKRNHRRKQISEAVSEALQSRGLSLNEVERLTGGEISHSFLSKLISGNQSNPRLDKLLKITDLLDVSLSELMGELEPDGLRVSKIWQLHKAYQKLDARRQKTLEREIDYLLEMAAAWLK